MDLDFLKNSTVFRELEELDLKILLPMFKQKEIAAGKTVFIENMPGESLYLVETGEVDISKMLAEGDEQLLVTIGPGEVFGELAILDEAPRSATARVNRDTLLWRLDRTDFDVLCRDYPVSGLRFIRNLVSLFCHRIRENNQEYREMILLGSGRQTA